MVCVYRFYLAFGLPIIGGVLGGVLVRPFSPMAVGVGILVGIFVFLILCGLRW